jgi:hypothetical protein
LNYLLKQRDAILGVPKVFLGETEGANRATADVALAEYIARLTALQANISQQLEDNLLKPLIRANYGEGEEVPEVRWREILPPTKTQNILNNINLYKSGLITVKEARENIGLVITDEILAELKAKAKAPQPFEMGNVPELAPEGRPPESKIIRQGSRRRKG